MKPGALALSTLCMLTACVESLPLGSECPETRADCPARDDPTPPTASPPRDAPRGMRPMSMDAGAPAPPRREPEAGPAGEDGSAAVDPAPMPRSPEVLEPRELVANGSFELNWGMGGSLGFDQMSGELSLNVAAPWGACRTGYYRVLPTADGGRAREDDVVLPRDAEYFIEYTAREGEWSALRQTLATDLERGQPYSFAIDVRASAGEEGSVELWGSLLPCLLGVELARGEMVGDEWQTLCLSFVAPADFGELVIKPVTRPGARVFFDHLRTVQACP